MIQYIVLKCNCEYFVDSIYILGIFTYFTEEIYLDLSTPVF